MLSLLSLSAAAFCPPLLNTRTETYPPLQHSPFCSIKLHRRHAEILFLSRCGMAKNVPPLNIITFEEENVTMDAK